MRRRDGTAVVPDARRDERIEPGDAAKFAATAEACATGRDLDPVSAANVRWLSGYRHPGVRQEPVASDLLAAFNEPRLLSARRAQVFR